VFIARIPNGILGIERSQPQKHFFAITLGKRAALDQAEHQGNAQAVGAGDR
jgi:hypothetical protein